MRRLLLALVILACSAAVAAGCGGDDSSGSALERALGYVPGDTPFAVAIDTDVDGDQYQALDSLLGRFPGGDGIKQMLRSQLEEGQEGVSYAEDVKPLLGNPFVVGASDIASFIGGESDDDFVAAVQVADQDALDRIIEKTGAEEQGEVAGATVYEDGDTVLAVEDDMVVLAGTRELLDAALERADSDEGLSQDEFEESLDGLPGEALARIYFDVQALIEQDPDAEAARRVEWVSALRTFGMTASAADDAVDVEFNLRTEGDDLSDEDLPLAAGEDSPGVVRDPGQIGIALRDPSQVVTFVESALQAIEPQTFGDYEAGKRTISQQLGIDIDQDIFDQLTGDLSVTLGVDGSFAARAEVEDPDEFFQTTERLADTLPQLGAGLGVSGVRRVGGLYEAQLADGGSFAFGMNRNMFVVGSDATAAVAIATLDPTEVEDASGSLVLGANAEQIATQVLQQLGPQLGLGGIFGGGLFARPLGDLTGSIETSTDGMQGSFRLEID